MAEQTPPAASGGRRRVAEAARRRPSPLTLIAVAVPLLTVAALAVVRPAQAPRWGATVRPSGSEVRRR